MDKYCQTSTAWKVSKYGAFSGPYFPVFSPNAGKYGRKKNPYLDTIYAVYDNGTRFVRNNFTKFVP